MRRLGKITGIVLLSLIFLVAGIFLYLVIVTNVNPPDHRNISDLNIHRKQIDTNCYVAGNNWLRKSNSGLWEMYVEGDAFTMGAVNGILAKELIHEQEEAFRDQIYQIVPSPFYRNFLKYLIGWFNRNLDSYIADEYKLEIAGVSEAASSEFDYIGEPYQRMMNYHAAHDIGHALQNLALVGCSSFATWDDKSQGKKLLIGRNFDFYVGDHFAENKIVQFVNPDKGFKFMMITWGGMIGVVSGMNMQGLTITLNAAKSEIPSGSATPISIVAREILQYAKNIPEAVAIARSRKTFVSESFLIGSLNDNKAVTLEITPDTLTVFDTNKNNLICTNHYKSNYLGKSEINREQMENSASVYREKRLAELLDTLSENTPEKTAAVLRNQKGLNNSFIGYGNEKSVNQLIAHHAVIFEPGEKKVWVSTHPWQLGAFMCYDLDDIFAMNGLKINYELVDSLNTIPPDTFLLTKEYNDFKSFRELKNKITKGNSSDVEQLIKLNPQYYSSYVIAGDYMFKQKEFVKAKNYYDLALTKEVATIQEQQYIREQLNKCNRKSGKI